MKMKKLLALVLAALLLVALAACGGGGQDKVSEELTPYQMVEKANEAMNDADSAAYDLTMDMTMSMPELGDEGTFAFTTTGTVQTEQVGENDYKMAYVLTQDMSAMDAGEMGMEIYYADGYMYYNMPDSELKYKMPVDMEEAMVDSTGLDELEEDMVLESTVADEGDGKVVTMTIDGAKMSDALIGLVGDAVGTLGEGDDMTINSLSYTVHLDADGNITSLEMPLDLSMTMSGSTMNMTMKVTIDVIAIGGVTVELPDDLADYPEMSLDDMLAE